MSVQALKILIIFFFFFSCVSETIFCSLISSEDSRMKTVVLRLFSSLTFVHLISWLSEDSYLAIDDETCSLLTSIDRQSYLGINFSLALPQEFEKVWLLQMSLWNKTFLAAVSVKFNPQNWFSLFLPFLVDSWGRISSVCKYLLLSFNTHKQNILRKLALRTFVYLFAWLFKETVSFAVMRYISKWVG